MAILVDLQGPKLRIGNVENNEIILDNVKLERLKHCADTLLFANLACFNSSSTKSSHLSNSSFKNFYKSFSSVEAIFLSPTSKSANLIFFPLPEAVFNILFKTNK